MADLPAIKITAVDQASAVIDVVKGKLVSFAASAFSAAAAGESLRQAIKLGDDIQQMSDTLGIAIDKVDQLSIIAHQNGTEVGAMGKAYKDLAVAMGQGQESTSKMGQIFAALGVSVKDARGELKSTSDVMGDVADALGAIPNETLRGAVGNEIFGKSYLQVAASLRNFRESQELANRVIELYGSVTPQAAAAADAFGDKLNALGEGSKRALLNGLVPGLDAVNVGLDALIKQGGAFQTGFGDVVSRVVKEVTKAFLGLQTTLQAVGTYYGAVFAAIGTRSLTPLKELWVDLVRIEDEGAEAAAKVEAAYVAAGKALTGAAAATDKSNRAQVDATSLAKLLAGPKKEEANAYDALIKRLQQTLASTADYNEEQKLQIELSDKKYGTVTAQDRALRDQAISLAQVIDLTKGLNEADKDAQRETDEITKALERAAEAYDKVRDQVNDMVAKLELEASSITTTNTEREVSIKLLELERMGIFKNTKEYEDYAARIRAAVDKKELLEQQLDLWKQVETSAHDAFMAIFESGRSVFERLTSALKSTLLELLYQMTVKRWVINIGAAGSAVPEQALASQLGGGQIFGLGNSLSTLGMFGSDFTQLIGQGIGFGQAISTALAGAGGFASVFAAAVPWAAIAAVAVPMVMNLFKSGGGPKEGGAFSQFAGFNLYPGETTSANNLAIQQIVEANALAYQQIARALGASGNIAQFALSYDTDPKGTAPNRVSAGAALNGKSVYSVLDLGVGRDSAALQSAITLEGQRAILAALQATELPKVVGDYLATINVGTATLEQIQTALTHAQELYNVAQGLASLNLKGLTTETLAMFAKGGESLEQTFGRIGGAYSSFVDAFTSPAEKLANEQKLVTDTFAALGIAVPDSLKAYRELVQGLDLSTESGRQMFQTLLLIAPAFKDVADAAKAVDAVLVHRIEREDEYGRALDRTSGKLRDLTHSLISFGTNLATIYDRLNPTTDRRGIPIGDARSGTPFGTVEENRSAVGAGQAAVLALINRDPAAQAMAQSSGSAYEALRRQAQALRAQIDAYDGSAESTRALTSATQDYYAAQVNLLAQIQQVKQATESMFGDTIRSLTLQTLDPTEKYRYLQNEAETLTKQLSMTSDPAMIKTLTERINADISQAFGLLSPEQQKAGLESFIAGINKVNTIAQQQLDQVAQDTTTSVGDVLTEVQGKLDATAAKLDAAVEKFNGAVDRNVSAADTNLEAANTPAPVQVIYVVAPPHEVNN